MFLLLSGFIALESMAIVGFNWEFFCGAVELKNGYVDWKMSPEPPSRLE